VLLLKETHVSTQMKDDMKHWRAKRKKTLIPDNIRGKTTATEASRAYDLPKFSIAPHQKKASQSSYQWTVFLAKPSRKPAK
jgi:hypothetical protein